MLGLTALAASIAPAPRDGGKQTQSTPTHTAAPSTAAAPEALDWTVPEAGARARVKRVAPGAHVVMTVAGTAPGQAVIPRLGRTSSLTASAPARFDLLAPPAGRYDVLFTPVAGGTAVRVGTLVSTG